MAFIVKKESPTSKIHLNTLHLLAQLQWRALLSICCGFCCTVLRGWSCSCWNQGQSSPWFHQAKGLAHGASIPARKKWVLNQCGKLPIALGVIGNSTKPVRQRGKLRHGQIKFLAVTLLEIEKGRRKISVSVTVCHVLAVTIGVSYQGSLFFNKWSMFEEEMICVQHKYWKYLL